MPYPPQKMLLKRKKKKILNQQRQNAPISQTSSEHLKVTIQAYRMGNKNEAWKTSRGNIKSIFASQCRAFNEPCKEVFSKMVRRKVSRRAV